MCRLLANAYSVYVAHLTTGSRVGSAAAEKLNLFAINAVHSYQSYPSAGSNPLQRLIDTVNTAGNHLSPRQQDTVLQELAKCFPRVSLLLTVLAHED